MNKNKAIFIEQFIPLNGIDHAIAWLEREQAEPSFSSMDTEEAEFFNKASVLYQKEIERLFKAKAAPAAKRLLKLLK